MGYIYVIENQINHKKYVGQTIDPIKRWNKHKNDDVKNPNLVLGKAFAKYGIDNFTIEIIENCDDNLMSEREMYWIKELKTFIGDADSNGYNMTRGGEAMFGDSNPFYGKKHTEKTRKRLSELAKEKTGDKNPFYKRHHSEETRKTISRKNKGRKHTVLERIKMSEGKRGEKNHFYGKTHSKDTKEKIRQYRLGKIPYNAIPYIAKNDYQMLYFESIGKIFSWLRENNLVDEKFTMSMLKTRLKHSELKHSLFAGHYWYKSVETIPDECKGVGLEISTNSKCATSVK